MHLTHHPREGGLQLKTAGTVAPLPSFLRSGGHALTVEVEGTRTPDHNIRSEGDLAPIYTIRLFDHAVRVNGTRRVNKDSVVQRLILFGNFGPLAPGATLHCGLLKPSLGTGYSRRSRKKNDYNTITIESLFGPIELVHFGHPKQRSDRRRVRSA